LLLEKTANGMPMAEVLILRARKRAKALFMQKNFNLFGTEDEA